MCCSIPLQPFLKSGNTSPQLDENKLWVVLCWLPGTLFLSTFGAGVQEPRSRPLWQLWQWMACSHWTGSITRGGRSGLWRDCAQTTASAASPSSPTPHAPFAFCSLDKWPQRNPHARGVGEQWTSLPFQLKERYKDKQNACKTGPPEPDCLNRSRRSYL